MYLKFACPILYIMNCIEIENFLASTFFLLLKLSRIILGEST